MKKVISLLFLMSVLGVNFINASTLESNKIENKALKQEYIINNDEYENFISNIPKEVNYEDKQYLLSYYDIEDIKKVDEIEINTSIEKILGSNNFEEILSNLDKSIEYNKNEYIGTYILDINNIKIDTIYNGFYEIYVDEEKDYFDLEKNDMSYIPKKINKNGIELFLINVEWFEQTNKNMGINTVTDLYRAKAYYRAVKRIDNKYDYKVTANYTGTARKEDNSQKKVIVYYNELNEIFYKESEKNNIIPALATVGTVGTSAGVIFAFYKKKKGVKNEK